MPTFESVTSEEALFVQESNALMERDSDYETDDESSLADDIANETILDRIIALRDIIPPLTRRSIH